jgi:proline iminopeptidase
MGHSFGGIIAVHYAYHSSQNTKGVLLTNATLNMKNTFFHQIQKGSENLNLMPFELKDNEEITSLMSRFYFIQNLLLEKDKYFYSSI